MFASIQLRSLTSKESAHESRVGDFMAVSKAVFGRPVIIYMRLSTWLMRCEQNTRRSRRGETEELIDGLSGGGGTLTTQVTILREMERGGGVHGDFLVGRFFTFLGKKLHLPPRTSP